MPCPATFTCCPHRPGWTACKPSAASPALLMCDPGSRPGGRISALISSSIDKRRRLSAAPRGGPVSKADLADHDRRTSRARQLRATYQAGRSCRAFSLIECTRGSRSSLVPVPRRRSDYGSLRIGSSELPPQQALTHAAALLDGASLFAKALLHLGSRAAGGIG